MRERFLEMLLVERGASPHTIAAYQRDLEDFAAFLAPRGRRPEAAGADDIRAWLADLDARGLATTTIARRLSAVRHWFRFLYLEGVRRDDPSLGIDRPRPRRPLPRYLAEQEVAALLAAARRHPGVEGVRLRALLELLYATGMRVSEAVALPLEALAADLSHVRVRGKGGRERLVPLHAAARSALRAWLDRRRTLKLAPRQRRWLFPSRGQQGHLTRQRVLQLLKQLAVEAGLDPARVSPHVLRHAFASHLLHHGADLRVVQTLLGHAHIATTEIYTHLQPERLAAVVTQLHPLAREAPAASGEARETGTSPESQDEGETSP